MRSLIAAMKVSIDGKMQGPEGTVDWVEAWSEDFGLTPRIDACLLGGGMYPVVDELRLITYPLIAGTRSDALFATAQRQRLAMCEVRRLEAGKIASTYRVIR